MKKALGVIVIVVVIAVCLALFLRRSDQDVPVVATTHTVSSVTGQASSPTSRAVLSTASVSLGASSQGAVTPTSDAADGDDTPTETVPAAKLYHSAEEALAALMKGAQDYDDQILDQFSMPGPDCTFCPELYRQVKDLLMKTDTPAEQRGYFAEVLAISGKTENISQLIEGVKNAKNEDERDLFLTSVGLSLGGDDVTKFLADQLNTTDQALKESFITAITNQGSKQAVETLYNYTVNAGDPDGMAAVGTGLAELVPDDEAVPYLREIAAKRDQYSHLAFKSLLNGSLSSVQTAFDLLLNSNNEEFDKKMIENAVDHVSYSPETEAYLEKIVATSSKPVARDFAKYIVDNFKANESDTNDEVAGDEQDFTPIDQEPEQQP